MCSREGPPRPAARQSERGQRGDLIGRRSEIKLRRARPQSTHPGHQRSARHPLPAARQQARDLQVGAVGFEPTAPRWPGESPPLPWSGQMPVGAGQGDGRSAADGPAWGGNSERGVVRDVVEVAVAGGESLTVARARRLGCDLPGDAGGPRSPRARGRPVLRSCGDLSQGRPRPSAEAALRSRSARRGRRCRS
jgi:hypothetical protein